jgi:uncharacterized protein YodC (DUF2158 family)
MISRKTHRSFAALALLLICLGCASTQGEAVGGRSWLSYLRYGSDDTLEEKASNRKVWESWWATPTSADTVPAPPHSQPAEPPGTPAEVGRVPGNALAEFAANKFNGSWTVSLIPLGPDRLAFGKGDKVKAKASPEGPTMTVEIVPLQISIDARYYSESVKESFNSLMRYRCRWKNMDGSESTASFREEELEPVPVSGRD